MIAPTIETFPQPIPTLELPQENGGSVQLDISGQSYQLREGSLYDYMKVFVRNEAKEYHSNAIQGRYEVANDFLVFTPHFPFENGLTYVVRVPDQQAESGYWIREFQVGEKEVFDEAKLTSIFPAAEKLPENLLRFYFYFNTPMKKGQALQHIELVDANGDVDRQAFMEFKQELWSVDGKRLTLLFDPGRIKRGVSTNEDLGPALNEGNTYSLRISGSWQDVYGQSLSRDVTKAFAVGPAYRRQIEVNDWVIQKPKANSKDKLSIQFDRIMDHALVQSMIQLKDENDRNIAGHWQMSEDEKFAQFTPTNRWKLGEYKIIFDPRMEDVTGNNLEGLLDQKTGRANHIIPMLVRHFSI